MRRKIAYKADSPVDRGVMNAVFHSRAFIAVFASIVSLAACAKSEDSAARDSDIAAGQDTGMAGMDHSQMTMNRGPAKNADHEFLRMMSDHHEGLVVMMSTAMQRASSASAKADAKTLHDKQRQERDSMVAMARTSYDETIAPMVMPSAKTMNDSLQQKTGAAYDREMYRHVIMHHQEAIKMIDDFLPRLTRADVRQMAEKMRTDQQREIREFQAKQSA